MLQFNTNTIRHDLGIFFPFSVVHIIIKAFGFNEIREVDLYSTPRNKHNDVILGFISNNLVLYTTV